MGCHTVACYGTAAGRLVFTLLGKLLPGAHLDVMNSDLVFKESLKHKVRVWEHCDSSLLAALFRSFLFYLQLKMETTVILLFSVTC